MATVALSLLSLILIEEAISQSTISWLSDTDYEYFKTSFLNLDYNKDGMVTLNEAKLGILSILDVQYLQSLETDEDGQFESYVYEEFHTYEPHKYNCVPAINSMDFVDCLIMSVRHGTSATEDAIIDFDNILNLYFGECDDLSPLDETKCSDLVKEGSSICNKDETNYCQISCFKCDYNGGSMLFESTSSKTKSLSSSSSIINALNSMDLSMNDDDKTDNKISSLRMMSRAEKITITGDHNQRLIDRKLETHFDYADDHDITSKIRQGHVCPFKTKNKHINRNRFVFMSDAHIEPWYNSDGISYISRFEDYNVENMFECHDNYGNKLDTMHECTLTGYSDPPLSYFVSALHAWNMYARRPEQSVLFYGGDAQAHSYLDDEKAVKILMNEMLNSMLYYFEPGSIFIMAGNNDGPHNSIFTSNGEYSLSESWANSLIEKQIVNNAQMPHRKYFIHGEYYNTVDLFQKTGYYMKPLSTINSNYFVIVTNTNLGSLNPTQQHALEHDLAFVSSINGKVMIMGHHPSVLDNMIPLEYIHDELSDNDIILGMFSGHIHYFSPTNKRGFTTLPAITQYAPYSAFAMADIMDITDERGYKKKKIRLTNENILMYIASGHQLVDSYCWQ